jgi:MFS transporter, NNP family, nitrate/nitrite transporter
MSLPQFAQDSHAERRRVLCLSTIAFTLMFNVWLMLGVLSIPIRNEFRLSGIQLDWLIATAILSGALLRLHFGIWADRFGGRNTMVILLLISAAPTYLLSHVTSYGQLLACASLLGLAGNSFSIGIAWNSAWYPPEQKGTALGVFGAGNVGAAGTKLLVMFAPGVLTLVPAGGYLFGLLPGQWRAIPAIYAVMLLVMAGIILWLAPRNDPRPGSGRTTRELMAPLRYPRVWRFSLYYVVVFGAYVALSGWLPKYYIDAFGVTLPTAALLTASFIFPASLLRPFGGYLSDKFGPRLVTFSVFVVMALALAMLCLPTELMSPVRGGPGGFAVLMCVVGCGMGIGKASVYKYIPNYFPNDVGAVGGLVGALGALGGFLLPPAFGTLQRWSGSSETAFASLLVLTLVSLAWLTVVILRQRSGSHAEHSAGVHTVPEAQPQMAVD